MVEEKEKIDNPPNKMLMTAMLISIIFFSFLLALGLEYGSMEATIAAFIMLVSMVIFFSTLELIRKPYDIIVQDDGFLLPFKILRSVFVPFQKVRWITDPEGEGGAGTIGLEGHFQYDIEYPACRSMRCAYIEKTGNAPPSSPYKK